MLGLSKLRYKATPGQINYAQRKKVVRHHPDKKLQADKGAHAANDDAFFKCIQKAHDTLIDPAKRRAFDSVDPAVSDEYPEGAAAAAGGDAAAFVELWRPIFERESRFSNKAPVPSIGTAESDKASVETFYDFWFTFDSWRSFEYNDKEGAEGGDSRDEKRYAEKKKCVPLGVFAQADAAQQGGAREAEEARLGPRPHARRDGHEQRPAHSPVQGRGPREARGQAQAGQAVAATAQGRGRGQEEGRRVDADIRRR